MSQKIVVSKVAKIVDLDKSHTNIWVGMDKIPYSGCRAWSPSKLNGGNRFWMAIPNPTTVINVMFLECSIVPHWQEMAIGCNHD